MRKLHIFILLVFMLITFISMCLEGSMKIDKENISGKITKLPKPESSSDFSIEKALLERRSVRRYKKEPLNKKEVSQLLWAAQGITNDRGFRTAPSAGALYPIELYLVVGNVEGFSPGLFRYRPEGHDLILMKKGDIRAEICNAALGQSWVENGALILIFTGIYDRTTGKYGERGIRYVWMEVGHAAQNVYLQATSLKLGTVVVGAFYDTRLRSIMDLSEHETPLCIMPVGRK